MASTIKMEIPTQWLNGIDFDTDVVVKEIVRLGVYQFKVRQALELYQSGDVSLGFAAASFGLSKRDLIREARTRGMQPELDDQTIQEEMAA